MLITIFNFWLKKVTQIKLLSVFFWNSCRALRGIQRNQQINHNPGWEYFIHFCTKISQVDSAHCCQPRTISLLFKPWPEKRPIKGANYFGPFEYQTSSLFRSPLYTHFNKTGLTPPLAKERFPVQKFPCIDWCLSN